MYNLLNDLKKGIKNPSIITNKHFFIKKKIKKKFSLDVAYIHITASYNNTILSLTDNLGNIIKNVSCGSCNYKGRFKKKYIASKKVAQVMISFCEIQHFKRIIFFLHGYGRGSEMVIRTFSETDIKILDIIIKDKIPYNGCRKKKKRHL